jgi:hypothetical protein
LICRLKRDNALNIAHHLRNAALDIVILCIRHKLRGKNTR